MSDVLDALRAERDAALHEAAFERGRASQALDRNEVLRHELGQLRERLKAALGARTEEPEESEAGAPTRRERELAERLRLAMDTNWRLERDRGRLERQASSLQEQLNEERQRIERLEGKVRALEGELRLRP